MSFGEAMTAAGDHPSAHKPELAACFGKPPGWWFPEGTSRETRAASARAVAICDGCPIRQGCREWALRVGKRLSGTWGGLLEHQRERVIDRLNAGEEAA